MSEALRTCWCCGGSRVYVDRLVVADHAGPCCVVCRKCGVMLACASETVLVMRWNRRASDEGYDELLRENEQLKQSVESYREEALGWHAPCDILQNLRKGMVR